MTNFEPCLHTCIRRYKEVEIDNKLKLLKQGGESLLDMHTYFSSELQFHCQVLIS